MFNEKEFLWENNDDEENFSSNWGEDEDSLHIYRAEKNEEVSILEEEGDDDLH